MILIFFFIYKRNIISLEFKISFKKMHLRSHPTARSPPSEVKWSAPADTGLEFEGLSGAISFDASFLFRKGAEGGGGGRARKNECTG